MTTKKATGDIVVPDLKEGEEYHAFIAHSSKDFEFVETLVEELEQYGFKFCFNERDFVPGHSTITSICDSIKKSRRTIILLSENFLKSEWFDFEVSESINKTNDVQKKIIIPILYKLEEKDIPHYVRNVTYIDHDDPYFFRRLRRALTDEASLSSTVPAGNVAHGLAWSYFYGFLNLVLPGLKDRVMKCNTWAECKDQFCQKLIIIMPSDCYCPGSLDKADDQFKFEMHIPFNATRAGNINRDYKSSVYSVKDKKDEQKYYCLCEFATPLLSMYEMEQGQIAGLSKVQKTHQMKLFVEKLNEILNHPNNKACHNTTIILEYDSTLNADDPKRGTGSVASLSEVVLHKIKSDIKKEQEISSVTDQLGSTVSV